LITHILFRSLNKSSPIFSKTALSFSATDYSQSMIMSESILCHAASQLNDILEKKKPNCVTESMELAATIQPHVIAYFSGWYSNKALNAFYLSSSV
jgi:hypothetical protein